MAIEQLRARIDAIDRKIVRLLNDRAKTAMQIGAMKDRKNAPAFAPAREEQVLRNVEAATRQAGVLSPEAIRAVYSEIISACRATERRLTIAFLGPRGTFSHHAARSVKWTSLTHRAARQRFGSAVELVPVSSIEAVFTEVAQGRASYGVAPIENTTEGGVGATLDMFMDSDLKVAAEILVRVHQSLLALPDTAEVDRIYSKAEVFGQCRVWLANHFPNARLIDAPSTSHAAEMASRTKGAAAIANEEAAEIYGLRVLHRAIEDNPFNMTRFYVLAKESPAPSGRDKSSILCFIKDEAGALHNILTPFWRSEINLTKIESWPSKRKAWDYCFFIDFEGHAQDPHIARALEQVRRKCSQMKILGSFPASA